VTRHLIVVNPRAGGGRALEASWRVEQLYRAAALDFAIARTAGAGHAERLAREAASEFAAVVAVGGDGTVHEIVNGLADAAAAAGDPARVAALAAIPIGTGNDFVKSLGVAPTVAAGFAAVRAGRRRRIDLGRAGPLRAGERALEREWFVNDFSAGFAALVVQDMVDPPLIVRLLTGHLAYFAAGLLRMFAPAAPMTLSIDGDGTREALLHEVHIGNGRFCGGGIQYTPRAVLDDGLLDVTTIHGMPQWRFLKTMLRVRSGTIAPGDGVEMGLVRRARVEQRRPFAVYLDGEHRMVAGDPARVEVEVVPAALDVLAP
jgi:YegS/Rv2252/BmrU family lipid kinase